MSDHGKDAFHTKWEQLEMCHEMHTKLFSFVGLDQDGIPELSDLSPKPETIRFAVISCAFLESATETRLEGETRAGVLRATRSGTSNLGIVVPAFVSKIVRHRQSQSD